MSNPTRTTFVRSTLLLSIFLLVLCVANAFTQAPGTTDLAFGDGGIVRTPVWPGYGQGLFDLVVQPDGKIIAVGYLWFNGGELQHRFLLVRYNENGSLDTTFGNEGVSAIWFGGEAKARSAAILTDGKILVTGEFQGNIAVARYNSNGTLDPSFGVGGLITKDLADPGEISIDIPNKVIVRPDGKFLVVAVKSVFTPGGTSSEGRSAIIITSHNSDGSLDESFGLNGVAKKSLSLVDNVLWHVFEGTDGSIFVHGSVSGPEDPVNPNGARIYDYYIQKFTSTGNTATNVGKRGTLRFLAAPAKVIKILPNRQIIVSQLNKLLLYNNNGSYQAEILAGNEVTINGIVFWPKDFMIQNDGKIISAGSLPGGFSRAFVRYLPNGTIDTTFGTNGISSVNPAFAPPEGVIFKLLSDGKILGASIANNNPFPILLVRHYGDSDSLRR